MIFISLNDCTNFNFDDNKPRIKDKMINIYFSISLVFKNKNHSCEIEFKVINGQWHKTHQIKDKYLGH